MPLVPGTGHADVMQIVTHFLHDFVVLVCVRIHREAKFVQSLGLAIDEIGDEAPVPVLGHGASHPYLSCLVHQVPAHRSPLGPQQTEGGEGLDTALDESLAPLIAAEMPEFVHQGSVGDIQG